MSVTAPPAVSQPYFPPATPETSFQPQSRKRRAQTPPMSDTLPLGDIRLNWLDNNGNLPPPQPQRAKKRRPNLANGLSSLSIQAERVRDPEALPSYEESQATRHEVDEDDLLEPTPLPIDDDLEIEVLPESSRRPRRQFAMSSSSETSEDETDLFSPRHQRRRAQQNQQPDTVEQPSPVREQENGFEVEDVTIPESSRRPDASPSFGRRKRQRSGMDVDMDTDDTESGGKKHAKWRRHGSSYEPEKDRIVVTSLSDSESDQSSSRSTSPRRRHDFNQPGSQGFTLSPSLLTHLLANQRNSFNLRPQPHERGLVLYRPLGIPPGPEIVQQWPGQPDQVNGHEDSGRFEELDEDEDGGGMEVDVDEPMQLD